MFIFCLIVDRTRACLKMHVLSYCVLGIMCVACVLHFVVHMQFRSKLVHDIINEAYLPKPRHQFSDFENASIVLEIGNTNTQALDTKHKAQIPTPIPQHTQKQTFERAEARVRENMSGWPGFGAIGNQSSDILVFTICSRPTGQSSTDVDDIHAVCAQQLKAMQLWGARHALAFRQIYEVKSLDSTRVWIGHDILGWNTNIF